MWFRHDLLGALGKRKISYATRFSHNPPALSIKGRQTWDARKTLERFFNSRPGISSRRFAEMIESLTESAVEVGKEMVEASKK